MFETNISNDIIFESKSDAVPFNYRISYKVSLICLIISKCCGKKGCSAAKIQMINSAVYSLKAQMKLLEAIDRDRVESTLIRYDPSISRAINLAIFDCLIIQQGNGLFRLADKGKNLAKEIFMDDGLMVNEKKFILLLSGKLTEEFITNISKNWR